MRPVARASAERPNLAAVAALAGVSASTASLAFSGAGPVSEKTRARVMAAAEKLNYGGPDPRAQSLRRGRSGIIGVVIEERLRYAFRDPINLAMLDGVADEAGTAGASLLLVTETDERSTIAAAPMDAVILFGCSTRLDRSVEVLRQRGMPIVAIEAEEIRGVHSIGLDNREGTARLARHLEGLGHARIAVVTLPLSADHQRGPLPADWEARTTSYTALERLRGVRDVFPEFAGHVASGSYIETGREAGLVVLSGEKPPTAVLAQSDLLALGVIRAAEELGMEVPRDVSVVGFDGIRIDGSEPYVLTTLVQPAVEKGRAAGRAALELLEGGNPPPVSFTSVFRTGNTTARAQRPGP